MTLNHNNMTEKPQQTSSSQGQVVPFRPRSRPPIHAFSNLSADSSPVDDLTKYSPGGEDRDEYMHRMKVNAFAVIFLAVLVDGGIWLVDLMAQQCKNQDCALSGRRNCISVTAPSGQPN